MQADPSTPPVTGAQIRAARAYLGASQAALAQAAGVARQTIQNVEATANPPTGSARAIVAALNDLGVTVSGDGLTVQGVV